MRRSRTTSILIGAAVGAAGAVLASWGLSPVSQLSNETLYVFVSESCPTAMNLLTQLETESELRDLVVPVLAEESSSRTQTRICTLLARDIRRRAPWLGLVASDAWICGRVNAWSTSTFQEAFVRLPSWSIADKPVRRRDEARILAARGLRQTKDEAHPLALISSEADPGSETPEETGRTAPEHATRNSKSLRGPYPLDEWRGYDIGF